MSRPHGLTLVAPLDAREEGSSQAQQAELLWYRHVLWGCSRVVGESNYPRRRLGENKSKVPSNASLGYLEPVSSATGTPRKGDQWMLVRRNS
jgi:hypothetical protein